MSDLDTVAMTGAEALVVPKLKHWQHALMTYEI